MFPSFTPGTPSSCALLCDICFNAIHRLLDVHVERGKPEETELRKVLEKEREIARLEADKQMDLAILCREMSDLTHDLTSTKSTNLDLKNKLNQEISYKNREREDILKFIVVMKNERKSIQHQEKELEAKLAKSEMIAKYDIFLRIDVLHACIFIIVPFFSQNVF